MRKFCFFFPLVESGIVIGVYGIIVWILYFVHALMERDIKNDALLLIVFLVLLVVGVIFELLLIYAFIKVNLFLIRLWRVYQIFLVGFLAASWAYDIVKLTAGEPILAFVLLDPIFLGIEVYFMIVVRAFQSHLEIINEPNLYHPVNEIDDEAYINDYY